MIQLNEIKTILSFGKKIFSLEHLSLLVLATPGSISLTVILNALMGDTPLKDLVLPLVVAVVSLSLYFIIFLLDFIAGVKASRHEAVDKSNYFSSAKGWSSIWKISTVFILVIWSSFFAILSALLDFAPLQNFFMLASGTIAIMASLLDIYSIGENQKRLTGKKASFFEWLEKLMRLIDEKIVSKIKP